MHAEGNSMKQTEKPPKSKKTLAQKLNTEKAAGYVFILPFIIGFLAFMAVPMAFISGFSLASYHILETPVFIGIENYDRC